MQKIPEDKQTNLQNEIKSDTHPRKLAEKITEWEEKFDMYCIDIHEVHCIKNGPNKGRPILQQ